MKMDGKIFKKIVGSLALKWYGNIANHPKFYD